MHKSSYSNVLSGGLNSLWSKPLLLFLLTLTTLHTFGQFSPEHTSNKAIYEAALMQHFREPGTDLIIQDSTSNRYLLKYKTMGFEKVAQWAMDKYNVDSSWRAFIIELGENKHVLKSLPLPANLFTLHRIQLVSRDSILSVLKKDNWKSFYALFPKAEGYVTLSQVILSEDQTKAIVELGNSRGSRSGAGYLLLLEKQKNGYWKLLASVNIWRS